jgi:hypothetical protein
MFEKPQKATMAFLCPPVCPSFRFSFLKDKTRFAWDGFSRNFKYDDFRKSDEEIKVL